MKLLLSIILLLSSTCAFAQEEKKSSLLWQTILIDEKNGVAHDIETKSISKSDFYYFVHRIRFKTLIELPNGKKASAYMALTAIDCHTRTSKVLSDVLVFDGVIVARNVTPSSEFSSPGEGSAHDIMVQALCGDPKPEPRHWDI
jgi:hypothetical protein